MRKPFDVIALTLALGFVGGTAHAWEPFRTANRNVTEGNQALREGDRAGALAAYDRAARELPRESGVHLNRGIALLGQGELDRAREALLAATEPPASPELRAAAYYDLGLAFFRQADAVATEENHAEAQRLFREAADGFRRSLRARPGNRDAAWNLELALRRIREEQEKQEQEEQQQEDQQQQQQDQQQQQQDQQQQDQQQQQQDQQQEDQQQQQDQQQQEDQQQQQDQQQQEGQDQPRDQEQESQDQQRREEAQPEQQQPHAGQGQARETPPSGGQELPDNVTRVLDALQNGEQNLERERARVRARRENRRITKDW
jgi:Ca-activated chloride channel family protein